ncbi:MAG TPA: hypothetical protein V6C58_22810 [Allocoleopsis sp.]
MINQITPEQETMITVILNKWQIVKQDPMNKTSLLDAQIQRAYLILQKKVPKNIKVCSINESLNAMTKQVKLDVKINDIVEDLEERIYQQFRKELVTGLTIKEVTQLVDELGRLLAEDAYSKVKKLQQYAVPTNLIQLLGKRLENYLEIQIESALKEQLKKQLLVSDFILISANQIKARILGTILTRLDDKAGGFLTGNLGRGLKAELMNKLEKHFESALYSNNQNEQHLYYQYPAFLDYCFTVLKCQYDPETWQIFQSLMNQSNWMFIVGDDCIIVDGLLPEVGEEKKSKKDDREFYKKHYQEQIVTTKNNAFSVLGLIWEVIQGCCMILVQTAISIFKQIKEKIFKK